MYSLGGEHAMSPQAWFIAGTIPPILAGGAHALLTLVDVVRPTYFAPRDPTLAPVMEDTPMRFGGRAAPTMWNAWLGFNISHGLGVCMFGLLCLLAAAHDFDGLGAIRLLAIGVAAAYLVVALRFWFWGPVLITGAATVCFTIAAVMSA
jgi:hypothetical protein